MKNRLSANLIAQLIALICIVSAGFYFLTQAQTKEIKKNTNDKARLYSSILAANIDKILDDNLKAFRSLQGITNHLVEIEPQIKELTVFSMEKIVLSSSRDDMVGRQASQEYISLLSDVIEHQNSRSIVKRMGSSERIIHFLPISSAQEGSLIGVLQVTVLFSQGSFSPAALRGNKQSYFRKEALDFALKLSGELKIFLKEANRNARYLNGLIDNMMNDQDITDIQIYSNQMNILLAASTK